MGNYFMKHHNRDHTGRMIFAIVLVMAITFSFVVYTLMPRLPEKNAAMENGVIDLTDMDLSAAVAKLPLTWEYYPGKLYAPEDFKAGTAGQPRTFASEDEQAYRIGTYRTILKVIPEETYAINAWSLDYATRIFADGKEVLAIGTVSETEQGFVPRMRSYTLPLISQTEYVEIIIQYANFSHHEGGAMREMTFGLAENVNRYAEVLQTSASMLGGALLLVAAFYFMLFLGGRGLPNLAFAMCCFFLATRNQQFVISLMPVDYAWSFVYRFVYINNICTGMAFLLLCYSLYPSQLPQRIVKPAVFGTVAVTLSLTAVSLFLPLPMIARLVAPSYIVFIPAIVCICWIFGKLFLKGRVVDRITAAGMAILFLSQFLDILLQRMVPEITRNGAGPFGMIAFAFCQMLALGMENASLERLNHMKTEFLQDMSHEMQNPLTVIATGVDFADGEIESGGEPREIRDALEIVREETQRLGRMVRGMVQLAEMDKGSPNRKRTDFAALLHSSAESFRILLRRQNNALRIDIAPGIPDVFVEADRYKQIITNLFTNALRHTHSGQITLAATYDATFITVRMTDTGEGIDAALQLRIFERGVSGRSGTGYGLHLCKTIVEAHGGTIEVESEPGKGTAVVFTVPVYGGQESEDRI